ncbi:hypothetical protein JCM16358_24300 [Halanaerocella petrolearia]
MRRRLSLGVILLILVLFLTACNSQGVGSLVVSVSNQQQELQNDIYVGIYATDYGERVKFGYTTKGMVQFKGLPTGIYRVKVIGQNTKKELKVKVNTRETNSVDVSL